MHFETRIIKSDNYFRYTTPCLATPFFREITRLDHMRISASEGRRDLSLGLNEPEYACLFVLV